MHIIEKARNSHVQQPGKVKHGTPVRTGTDDQQSANRHIGYPFRNSSSRGAVQRALIVMFALRRVKRG